MFRIRKNNKASLGTIDPDDETVAEAIYSTYSDYTYDIELTWNELVIPLDIRGDISDMYNDIISMLSLLKINERVIFVSFLSSTFTAKWCIDVKNDILRISPKWITVAFSGTSLVSNKMDILVVSKTDFINEWDKLLKIIKNDLIKVGYNKELDGFDYLQTLSEGCG